MKNKIFIRSASFLMVLILILGITACKSKSENSSTLIDDSTYESSEQEPSNDSSENITSSDTNQSTTTSKNSSTSTNVSKTYKFASDPYSDIPASVKSKPLKVFLWQAPSKQEKERIENFQKTTGIKVDLTYTPSSDVYYDKLISKISAGDCPDVVFFAASVFPSNVVKLMSALNPKIFKLDDPIWDKKTMDQFKINGKYYGVNIAGNFGQDTLQVLYYNKTLLEKNSIQDPYNLWKQGNWNWDVFETLLAKVKASSSLSSFTPLYMQRLSTLASSSGTDFLMYNGDKFNDNLNDTKLVNAYSKLASWRQKGYVTSSALSASGATSGSFVFFSCIAYHLKSQDTWWSDNNGNTPNGVVRAVPFPSPAGSSVYTASDAKMFGTAKGSQNKEAAAYFLRYYLDPKNQDMEHAFLNSQAKEVWDYACKQNMFITMSGGVVSYVNSASYTQLSNSLIYADSNQIRKVLSEQSNIITKSVNAVNTKILKK